MDCSSSSTYSQNKLQPIYYSSTPPLSIPKIIKRNTRSIVFDLIIFLAVLQLTEILICINNFLEFFKYLAQKIVACFTEQAHDILVRVMARDLLSRAVKLFPENSGKIRYYILCNAPCFHASGRCYLQYFFCLSAKSLTDVCNHCKCN